MKKGLIEDIIAGSYSLILHIILVGLFIMGMDSQSTPKFVAQPKVNIVQATVMDEVQVLEEMARLQEFEDKKRKEEQDRQTLVDKKLEDTQKELDRKEKEFLEQQEKAKLEQQQRDLKVEQEQKKIKKLEQDRKLEDEKRIKAEADRKIAEQKRKAEQELKQKAEKERLIAEDLKQDADKKRREAEEKQRLAEADRKAEEKRKADAEKARKVAEEKKRKAELALKAEEKRKVDAERAESNRLLQEELAKEDREREEMRVNSVVNQHVSIIRQRVKRYWNRPAGSLESGLQTALRVSLIPSGDVRQVVIVHSSGNAVFDRSAESAVYKAAPFAMPTDAKAAAELRDFQFIFKPE